MAIYNKTDQKTWENIFKTVSEEQKTAWKDIKPLKFMEDCLTLFKEKNTATVLDLGCGVGRWSIFLARNGLKVWGTDFSEAAITFAKNWALEEKLGIQFSVAPVTEVPSAPRQFDAVLASLILDNIAKEELEIVLKNVRKTLKKGQPFFAIFNPYMSAEEIIEIKKSDNPTKDITFGVYTDDELKGLFPGFTLLDFRKYEFNLRGLLLERS